MYLAGAGVLLGLYYLAMVLWLYRHRIKEWATPRTGAPLKAGEEAGDFLSYDALTLVATEIRHGILMEAGNQASKQELLTRLRAVLVHHGGLRTPASRGALNQFIVQQARALCGVTFSEEELEREWESLPWGEEPQPSQGQATG